MSRRATGTAKTPVEEPLGMSGYRATLGETTSVSTRTLRRTKAAVAAEQVQKAISLQLARGITTESETPPYRIDGLISVVANSSVLPQHILAMATNIDGFGHTFEAKLDPTRDDLDEVVASAMELEGTRAPKPEAVRSRCAQLRTAMSREHAFLKSWFDHCTVDDSFVSLRKRTRIDLETTGNAYWEILRDAKGVPQQIIHVAVASIEATKLGEPIEVPFTVQISPISIRRETRFRRFRRYVQGGGSRPVWYKEHGDPRLMSNRTGRYYRDPGAMSREEPEARPATEIRHWKIYSPRSMCYGVPRWVGATNAVVGTTKAEEVNYLYFDNKSIPPLALLVSGGNVSDETIQSLKDVVENDIQGTKNFHRILIVQAAGAVGAGAGEVKIELKPLTSAQLQDGQFMQYLRFNAQTIGSAFRLPPLYRGDVEAFNRATAEVAVQVAEEQVFQPERGEFDFIINRFFLPDLDVLYWVFRSNGPNTTDFRVRSEMLSLGASGGALTLNEYRARFGQVYDNRELEALLTPWADLPVPVAVALASAKNPGIFIDVPQIQGVATPSTSSAATTTERPASSGRPRAGRPKSQVDKPNAKPGVGDGEDADPAEASNRREKGGDVLLQE